MATRIHPKNVHEKSPKNVHEMSPKKRTSHGQKCPRNVTKSVHEMSPIMSTRCLPPIIFGFKTIADKLFHLPCVNQTQLLREDYFPFFCLNPSSIFTKTSSRRLTRFNLNGVLGDLQKIPSRIAISC